MDAPQAAGEIARQRRHQAGDQRGQVQPAQRQHFDGKDRTGQGVPNTAPKPAATPPISSRRRALPVSPSRSTRPCARLPPSCTAVPSRPADPPNRCVATVPISTSGAMASGTPPPGS
jgi:hypothetical protein